LDKLSIRLREISKKPEERLPKQFSKQRVLFNLFCRKKIES
jgi:hypothetical protein